MSGLAIVTAKLLATSAVTAIVGQDVNAIMAPQTTEPPNIVLNLAGGNDQQMLSGAGKMYEQRIATESVARTATAAVALGDAVIDALQDVVKQTIAGCTDVDIALGTTDYTDWAEDRSLYRRTIHFSVKFRT